MKSEMYLVEFLDGSTPFFTENAVSFKDMIIQLADSTGANCPLFLRALESLSENNDIVALYNMFSSWVIDRVLKVDEISYERLVD